VPRRARLVLLVWLVHRGGLLTRFGERGSRRLSVSKCNETISVMRRTEHAVRVCKAVWRLIVSGERVVRLPARRTSVAVTVTITVAVCTAAAYGLASDVSSTKGDPPVPGQPLPRTGLQLLVAGRPPFAVNVDERVVNPISVPGESSNGPSSLVQTGSAALLVGAVQCATCGRNQPILLVRRDETTAVEFARAWNAIRARGAPSAWLLTADESTACSLKRVPVDGSLQGPLQPSICGVTLAGRDPPGLIFDNSILIDPTNGRALYKSAGMIADVGLQVLTRTSQRRLELHDIRTKSRRRVQWPSIFQFLQGAEVPSRGSLVAIEFVSGPVDQHIDFWILDTRTEHMTHVPGFPVAAEIKRTAMTWTDDRRLVILTRIRGKDALVVWRPGQRRSASAYLNLPAREPGMHAMVAWVNG
jgi:hypothetical protein